MTYQVVRQNCQNIIVYLQYINECKSRYRLKLYFDEISK